jgi:Carbamoyl-phosphate synthetase large chain, oligomerisation domain
MALLASNLIVLTPAPVQHAVDLARRSAEVIARNTHMAHRTPQLKLRSSFTEGNEANETGRSGAGGDGKPWRIGTAVHSDRNILPRDVISRKLSVPNAERIFFIRHALRAGFTIEEIFNLTKIDRWFLLQIKEIVDFEGELAGAKN